MPGERKPREPKYNVLGYFDKKTRLAASSHAFVIQVQDAKVTPEDWKAIYFYVWIGDAIRGYVKHLARKKGKVVELSKDLNSLLDKVSSLEKTVKDVAESLSKQFEQRITDPIEALLVSDDVGLDEEEEEEDG